MTPGPIRTIGWLAAQSRYLMVLCGFLHLWGGAATPLHSQETIASDRPGIGSGSFVLRSGTLQLESGAEYSRTGAADVISPGQVLLRIGLGQSLEFQGMANSLVLTRGDGPDQEGLQDLGIGAKVSVVSGGAGGLSVSVLSTVTFPSGADAFSSGGGSTPPGTPAWTTPPGRSPTPGCTPCWEGPGVVTRRTSVSGWPTPTSSRPADPPA